MTPCIPIRWHRCPLRQLIPICGKPPSCGAALASLHAEASFLPVRLRVDPARQVSPRNRSCALPEKLAHGRQPLAPSTQRLSHIEDTPAMPSPAFARLPIFRRQSGLGVLCGAQRCEEKPGIRSQLMQATQV